MYANDNGNYTPALGGCGIRTALSGKKWYALTAICGLPRSLMMVTESQPWNRTNATPNRPIGLGLIWKGGCLTQKKSASILYCPSDNSDPKTVVEQQAWIRYYDQIHFDKDEPFYTSKGTVVRGNRNGLGNIAPWSSWVTRPPATIMTCA